MQNARNRIVRFLYLSIMLHDPFWDLGFAEYNVCCALASCCSLPPHNLECASELANVGRCGSVKLSVCPAEQSGGSSVHHVKRALTQVPSRRSQCGETEAT